MSDATDTTTDNAVQISTETNAQRATRERVLRAATELLESEGREALTTRAIATAAGVQPPALYRLFGDKDGLLDALGAHGFAEYLLAKRNAPAREDPVQALRDGWDTHIGFGLEHPAFYLLVYGEPSAAGPGSARRQADALLRGLIERVAEAGRLRTSVRRAVEVVNAAGVGAVMTLLAMPEAERDAELSPMIREATLRGLTAGAEPDASQPSTAASAATLSARLRAAPEAAGAAIGGAERALLLQWLDAIAEG